MIEERIAERYAEQQMRCPVHLSIGQEAVPVGVCAHLSREDYVMSGHRSHGNYLAKGGDLKRMLAELYGKVTGCSKGNGGSMHLVDLSVGYLGATPIVSSTIPIAVGAALGSVMRGDPRVTVTFFGDGATEEGVFYESLNFAALKQLPVLFICENNLYSVYSPRSVRQPHNRNLVQLAQGQGVESYQGDGNDVVEVYRLSAQAVRKARAGGGPTLLELNTYRWREHCGPNYDNNVGYRTESEFQAWKRRCPIATFQQRLVRDGLLTPKDLEGMAGQVHVELDEAFAFATASPLPHPSQLMDHLYAS
jgi:pyruvate dehydrogenase E1 component alpha subunit